MGQAKARAAEIKALKAGSRSKQMSLLDVMIVQGDGNDANKVRMDLMRQICMMITANHAQIMDNATRGKTTRVQGIQVGFDKESMSNIEDCDVSVRDRGAFNTISEFMQALRPLQIGMYANPSTKIVSPAFFFQGSTHSIIVSNWGRGTLVDFVPNVQVDKHNASSDSAKTAAEIHAFMS
jgi:hypothetical protein